MAEQEALRIQKLWLMNVSIKKKTKKVHIMEYFFSLERGCPEEPWLRVTRNE